MVKTEQKTKMNKQNVFKQKITLDTKRYLTKARGELATVFADRGNTDDTELNLDFFLPEKFLPLDKLEHLEDDERKADYKLKWKEIITNDDLSNEEKEGQIRVLEEDWKTLEEERAASDALYEARKAPWKRKAKWMDKSAKELDANLRLIQDKIEAGEKPVWNPAKKSRVILVEKEYAQRRLPTLDINEKNLKEDSEIKAFKGNPIEPMLGRMPRKRKDESDANYMARIIKAAKTVQISLRPSRGTSINYKAFVTPKPGEDLYIYYDPGEVGAWWAYWIARDRALKGKCNVYLAPVGSKDWKPFFDMRDKKTGEKISGWEGENKRTVAIVYAKKILDIAFTGGLGNALMKSRESIIAADPHGRLTKQAQLTSVETLLRDKPGIAGRAQIDLMKVFLRLKKKHVRVVIDTGFGPKIISLALNDSDPDKISPPTVEFKGNRKEQRSINLVSAPSTEDVLSRCEKLGIDRESTSLALENLMLGDYISYPRTEGHGISPEKLQQLKSWGIVRESQQATGGLEGIYPHRETPPPGGIEAQVFNAIRNMLVEDKDIIPEIVVQLKDSEGIIDEQVLRNEELKPGMKLSYEWFIEDGGQVNRTDVLREAATVGTDATKEQILNKLILQKVLTPGLELTAAGELYARLVVALFPDTSLNLEKTRNIKKRKAEQGDNTSLSLKSGSTPGEIYDAVIKWLQDKIGDDQKLTESVTRELHEIISIMDLDYILSKNPDLNEKEEDLARMIQRRGYVTVRDVKRLIALANKPIRDTAKNDAVREKAIQMFNERKAEKLPFLWRYLTEVPGLRTERRYYIQLLDESEIRVTATGLVWLREYGENKVQFRNDLIVKAEHIEKLKEEAKAAGFATEEDLELKNKEKFVERVFANVESQWVILQPEEEMMVEEE